MSVLIELLGHFSYPKSLFLSSPTLIQLEYPLSGFKTLNYYRCGMIRAVTGDQRGQSLYLINVFKCIISFHSHNIWVIHKKGIL